MAVYVTADARNYYYPYYPYYPYWGPNMTKQLMQDLKKNFKNIQFQNMFFNHITEFDGQDGLKEWVDNANMWSQKSYAKSEEECKQLFKNWIKNQIQKSSAKAIVMMDEMCVLAFCNSEKFRQDPSNIILDLSFLEEYENVKFVICVSPIFSYIFVTDIEIQNSFDLDFHNAPENSEKATYHHLSARYRNTAGILDFINFIAKNFPNDNYNHTCKNFNPMVVTRAMDFSKNHALLMCRI